MCWSPLPPWALWTEGIQSGNDSQKTTLTVAPKIVALAGTISLLCLSFVEGKGGGALLCRTKESGCFQMKEEREEASTRQSIIFFCLLV